MRVPAALAVVATLALAGRTHDAEPAAALRAPGRRRQDGEETLQVVAGKTEKKRSRSSMGQDREETHQVVDGTTVKKKAKPNS